MPEFGFAGVGEEAVDGAGMVEGGGVLLLEVLVVGEGVGDEGVGLPDAFEALAADGVDEAGGDAGTAGFAWVVYEEDVLAGGGEAFGEDGAGESAAEDDCCELFRNGSVGLFGEGVMGLRLRLRLGLRLRLRLRLGLGLGLRLGCG